MKLKGKLFIVGGAEDKGDSGFDDEAFRKYGILERLVEEAAHEKKSRIEIITTASTIPKEVGADYIKAFAKLGVLNVDVLDIADRNAACDPASLDRLNAADVVFFSGGDQLRLSTIIGGTLFYNRMIERLQKDPGFIYAGTSAGAVAASQSMISEGSSEEALLRGEVQTVTGFGLLENIVFDTHFIKRGRIGRLFEIIVTNPKVLGVGLDENTGLFIHNNKMEAIGAGMTVLVDGRYIKNHNLLEIREGAPISIENLKVHVMSRTDVYDLNDHTLKIHTPEDCRR